MLQIWPRITPAGPPTAPLPLARSWHKQVIIINKQQLAIFQRVENINNLYFCYNLIGPWLCLTFRETQTKSQLCETQQLKSKQNHLRSRYRQ